MGPHNHIEVSKVEGDTPRVARSAGFALLLICCYWVAEDNVWIFATLLATQVFHQLAWDPTQASTKVESVYNWVCDIG
ncbi:hypothetical protein TNCV_202241 [Trichonephila clavipes]|nr:hypothetical protein TNCV_202241 [Trichonephila clavipes]